MAKKEKDAKQVVDPKELNKFLNEFSFDEPDKMEDGTIRTPRYETGIIMLDGLLNGGLPVGKVIAMGAEWGVGKTTLFIQACGNVAEKYRKKVYYLDVEGGATFELWNAMGYSDLLYHPKNNPEGLIYLLDKAKTIQAIAQIINKVTKDPDTAIIVIDSDTSVTDQLILDDEFLGTNKNDVGTNARMWSKVARPLNQCISTSQACLLIVHQARVDLSGFMPKVESAGGNALKHLASVEIWGKKKAWIGAGNVEVKSKEEAIGAMVKLTTTKNRLTMPFASITLPIFFGRGASNKWAYKEWLESHTIMDKLTGEVKPMLDSKGSWQVLTLPSNAFKFQGDEKLWKHIEDNFEEIENYVKANGGFAIGHMAEDED